MGKSTNIDIIPVPLLIINTLTNEIVPNDRFVKEFNNEINSIDDLNDWLTTPVLYSLLTPQTISGNGCFGKTGTPKQPVQLTLSAYSENENLLVVNAFRFDINLAFKDKEQRRLLNDIPLGIIIKNKENGVVLYISDYLINKTGYTAQEIAQNPWTYFTYKDDIPKQEALLNETMQNGLNSFFFEKRIVSKTGKIYWFSEFIKTMEISGGIFQIILLRDITNEKEMEAELQRAKHLVEDAERLKSAFLDNLPHEIRTPLHSITGFTSLLSDSTITQEEQLEYLKFIQDSSNDILNLMDNIIEIAKLETNQIKPKKEKCYINSIIDKLSSDIVSKQNIFEKENLTIKVVKAEQDPTYFIISDPERIYEIMNHLLNNALKFTYEGEIEFGYSLPAKNRIEFFVRDTGIGIAPDELDIIFKKFGKSGNINTSKNRGTGLGLALSKKLVELLKGDIKLSSVKGEGSTFSFQIPIDNEQKISITKPSVSGETNWSSKNILIAEDTESNYFFIEAFLERTNVNLIWAQDGQEAVDLFKKHNINLVLMDIMMPEKDGFDATREIKAINANVPVIAQTALALPDDEEKCYLAGCDYVLVKPINSEDLIASIRRFIL
jgi:PAS domain S-box-containing protein